jgi:hypothetical protein
VYHPWPQVLDFFGTPLVIEPAAGQLSRDAGLLPIRPFDQRIGLTPAFAQALDDRRDPDLTEPTFPETVRARVYGILAGYADPNDHDTLRTDPVFKRIADCWCVGGLLVEKYRRQAGTRSPGENGPPVPFPSFPLEWRRNPTAFLGASVASTYAPKPSSPARSGPTHEWH